MQRWWWLLLLLACLSCLLVDDNWTYALAEQAGARDIVRLIGENLQPVDHLVVLAKTLVPGLLMAAISCHEGLSASRSITAVPPAVTAAVVRSLAAVFVWDSLVTAMVYVA